MRILTSGLGWMSKHGGGRGELGDEGWMLLLGSA